MPSKNPGNPIADGDGNVISFLPPDVWEKLDTGGPNATVYHVRDKTPEGKPQKSNGKVTVAWSSGGMKTYELKPSSRVTVTREPRSHVVIEGDLVPGKKDKQVMGLSIFSPSEGIGVVGQAPLPIIETATVQIGGVIAPGAGRRRSPGTRSGA